MIEWETINNAANPTNPICNPDTEQNYFKNTEHQPPVKPLGHIYVVEMVYHQSLPFGVELECIYELSIVILSTFFIFLHFLHFRHFFIFPFFFSFSSFFPFSSVMVVCQRCKM